VLVNGAGLASGLSFQVASTKAVADPGKNAAIKDFLTRVARGRGLWAVNHQATGPRAWGHPTPASRLTSPRSPFATRTPVRCRSTAR